MLRVGIQSTNRICEVNGMVRHSVFCPASMLRSLDPRRLLRTYSTSMSALAICTNPLAREVMPLWHLDRVLDTQGGVHDSPTSAHAGRSAAAQLLRTHDPSLHPHRR